MKLSLPIRATESLFLETIEAHSLANITRGAAPLTKE